jgi:hypothetical protein
MDLQKVSPFVEPIRLIGGIPGALGKSVAFLLFTKTSQDLGGLDSDPALAGSLNECFFEIGWGAR